MLTCTFAHTCIPQTRTHAHTHTQSHRQRNQVGKPEHRKDPYLHRYNLICRLVFRYVYSRNIHIFVYIYIYNRPHIHTTAYNSGQKMSSFRHRQEGVRTHRPRAFRVAHRTMAPRISIPTASSTPSPPYILDISTFILYVSPPYRPPLHRSIVGTRGGKAPHAGVRHVEIYYISYIYIYCHGRELLAPQRRTPITHRKQIQDYFFFTIQ